MSARLYATVYAGNDLPTSDAEVTSKSLGTVNEATELECRPMLHGTGSGRIKISRYHTQAALLQQDRYLLVHSDAGIIGGFFLDEGTLGLSAEKGKGGEFMEWTGQGPMAVLRNGNMDADSNISGGHNPIDGYWDLDNQGPAAGDSNAHPIPMMKRVLVEMDLNSPSGIDIVDHSSWTYDTDSDGASVPFLDGEAQGAQVGDTGLDLIARMDQLGGVVFVMSPLFKLDAYLSFGTDRSGAFATDTVRFEKGVNIAAAVQRKVRGAVNRTHLIVEGQDRTYVTVVDPDYVAGDIVRWGYLSVPETSNTDQLEAAGLAHIEQRKRQTDSWTFPQHDHGDDPANGIYEPAPDIADGHYWLGDSVALHTGSGSYDANEETVPIAAITFQLKTGSEGNGDYWVIPEVGSTFMWSGDQASFTSNITPAPPSTIRLCAPARVGTGSPEFVDDWVGTPSLVSGMTVPNDPTQILLLFYVSGSAGDLISVSYDPDSTTVLDPQPQLLSKLTEMTAPNGETLQVWYLLAPTASVGANGSISYGVVGTATKCHAVLLKNVDQTTPLRASEQTTAPDGSGSISNAVASLASDFVVSFLGFTGQDGGLVDPVPGGSQTLIYASPAWRGPGDSGAGMGLSYQVGASQTNAWTVHNASSNDNFGLGQLDLMFGGEASSNPLNGTSNQAARCDKSEHEILARDPTVNDDEDAGYPRRTIWHNSTSGGATFISTDGTAGAAVWAEIGTAYTDEQAQDAVGGMIADTATVNLTYTDATPELKADVIPAGIKLDDLGAPDDNTDLNASTSKHGLLPKLTGVATDYLDGTGAFSTPPGGASLTIEEEDGTPSGTPSTLKVTNGTLTDNGDGSFSLDIPSPTGGTVNVEEEDGTPSVAADTIKFPNASVTDNGDGSVSVAFPAGGGSTGWTKLINADDMSTLTNWTVRSGTWTAGGTYGVNQTANDQDDFLECNENLSAYTLRAIQATVRLTNTGKVGMGFADSGGWGGGDLSIALDDGNDDVWWDRFGIGGSSVNFTVAQNTDYVLLLVEQSPGNSFKVYVDGVYQTLVTASSVNAGRVGLYCRNGAGWFRDVTVWGWSPGIPT